LVKKVYLLVSFVIKNLVGKCVNYQFLAQK